MRTGRISFIALGFAIGFAAKSNAQDFKEDQGLWKTENIRARNLDTVRLERHSFFALPEVDDTVQLTYHEPMPDSVMPKTSIEIGQITIQATTAEEVISALEKQARSLGADWIVSFNEPRLKFNDKHEAYYRSQAMLYKVINPDLVPQDQIAEVDCNQSHLKSFAAIAEYMRHIAKQED
jgi:hypothetical protein